MRHVFRATVDHDPVAGEGVALSPDACHHLARVARLGPGAAIEVVDTQGRIWPAAIEQIGPPVLVRIGDAPRPAPGPLPIDLYVGALEWGRFDLVVEKCTEIGVARIAMFKSERSAGKTDQAGFDRRAARAARLIDAAVRQSGQGHRPELRGLVPFSTMIDDVSHGAGFLVDRRGEHPLGATVRAVAPAAAAVIVGSDAGFSLSELAQATGAGLHVCRLGESMLRAETAALVAVAIAADGLGAAGQA